MPNPASPTLLVPDLATHNPAKPPSSQVVDEGEGEWIGPSPVTNEGEEERIQPSPIADKGEEERIGPCSATALPDPFSFCRHGDRTVAFSWLVFLPILLPWDVLKFLIFFSISVCPEIVLYFKSHDQEVGGGTRDRA